MTDERMAAIERIAQTVAGWGDGWSRQTVDKGEGREPRVAVVRATPGNGVGQIEFQPGDSGVLVFVQGWGRFPTGGRFFPTTFSIRNTINRRALDYINKELDGLLALLSEPEPRAISEAEVEAGAKALRRFFGDDDPVVTQRWTDQARAVLTAAADAARTGAK